MITQFLLPIITAVLGAVISYFITKWIESGVRPKFPQQSSRFSGKWFALHLTKRDSSGECVLSNHEYTLKISNSGKVTGTFEDLVASPPIHFKVTGILSPGGLVLICEGDIKTRLLFFGISPTH